MTLNRKEISVLGCALADLIGSYQAMKQDDLHIHDWKAHWQTIKELCKLLDEDVPKL